MYSAQSVSHAEASPLHSPQLHSSPRLAHHRANAGRRGSECGGGRKTLSMENIQSLNAAYAASGPVYVSDQEALASTTYPKGTMTLGRTTSHGKAANMSSSTNISSSLGHLHLDSVAYTDHGSIRLLPQHQWPSSPLLRQAVRGVARREGNPLIEHLRELQMDNMFRREPDSRDSNLASSVNSIKTFWSPELKKKRGMRKESVAKVAKVKEQMGVTKNKNQHLQMAIHALQDELCSQKDLNDLLQQENSTGSLGSPSDYFPYLEPTQDNFHYLQTDHEKQGKELFLLRKTVEEMDQCIKKQKQTLNTRDEYIKKLLEVLQEKGCARSGMPEEDGLRVCRAEDMLGHLGEILEQKEKENKHLKESTEHPYGFDPDVIWQDTKISSLERNIRELEDDVQMLKTNSHLNMDNRDERPMEIDIYKNHTKFMKSKIDQLKQDLSKKESEMLALQTQLDTLTNQNSDCKQHIEVLKESLSAKEQRANIMQTEIDALRLRLEEKESFLNKKSKQLQDLTDEKGTLNGEIHDLKDMLEVKERKIIVLQKKIENLQDQLKDKDKQLGCLRDRVKSLQTDSSNTDTALATLEEALADKERVIEQLKEKREKGDWDKQGEVDVFKKENKELKDKVSSLQAQLLEKENLLQGKALAREEASQSSEISERLKVLEKDVTFHKEEAERSKAEVDRLLGLLKELESERTQKDNAISELERQVKEQISKNMSSATNPQTGDTRPPDAAAQAHVTQDSVQETAKKIKELEKALRESMNASMHREISWVQEEHAHALAHRQLEDLMGALENTRQELDVTKQQLSSTQNSLAERESHLSSMMQEHRKQLEEILEMKQQALLAAISEKDANIALLELSSPQMKSSQEEVMALKREKDRLMYQLKQQTQNRMKLIAENYEDGHHHHYPSHPHHPHPGHQGQGHTHHHRLSRGPSTHSNSHPEDSVQPEQDDEEGIWA